MAILAFAVSSHLVALDHDLVDIKTINPRIRYASTRTSPMTGCFIRYEVAQQLHMAQCDLEQMNLGLKIFETYCPVTQKLAELSECCNEGVDFPEECLRHCRGTSVDVTLVDGHGEELVMPTAYDDFCPEACSDCMNASFDAIVHREMLAYTMEQHGFVRSPHAWWHFDCTDWENYDELDVIIE